MPVGDGLTWGTTSATVNVSETATVNVTYGMAPTSAGITSRLNSLATATLSGNTVTFTGVSAGTVTIPSGTNVGNACITTNAFTLTVASAEDESYLNKRGLTHFWENIDDLKQNKLTAGAGILITNDVISATGGGTADDVAWGHITGTMSDQTDLTTALGAKANSADLATVATSGDYDDLTDKPTIGNATLTIQKNGTSAGTFTANATSNKTINITVPTTAADVSALPASTKYGASIAVSINTTDYKVTTTLKDQDGNTLGTAQVIDLPLESVVVNGSYDSTNKKIVLTLQSGSTIDIPVADLVAGLQSEITSTNKLSSDLVDDTNHTHKFVTAAQITKLNGIAAGAEVNVQSDWTQTTTTADDYIKNKPTLATVATSGSYNDLSNKPTIPAAQVNSDWNATSGKAQILNKPTLATVATSGSYNDLSNKPTIPAAQVQSNWTQTTTTAVDYIKNKPTLATVATSGSYNDLSNKPTIPTVNNATLTIQKNGTNVQTFTANQSTNATANITVPTNTNELTNGAGFITSSGTAAKANQLTTARTIAISGGATGTATSFNGTSNISIPVTDVKDAYVTWGGKSLASNVTPDDMGCIDEFGHNKLAFLPAECIEIKYSTDGGSTWTDYGASDANKVKMVSTAGPGFYVGGSTDNATASNIANLKLRVRIAAGPTSGGKVYTAVKKILINISTQGCSGNKVDIKYRTIANYKAGTETWTTVGTYDVAGGSGWNSIPFAYTFGGSFTSQTSQMGQIEFVFYSSGLGTWGLKKLSAIDFRMIGSTNWAMPSEMARAGHLYTVDEAQNATFPANVSVTGSLKHGNYTYTLPSKNGTVAMTSDLPAAQVNSDWNASSGVAQILNKPTLATVATSGSYNDLSNKPTIPAAQVQSNWTQTTTTAVDYIKNKPTLATVATSGSYNDLSNKPTIPTVNNATLTIQKNGSTVKTFTANASSNVTANITVPTKTSDLTNDSGFVNSTAIAGKQDLLTAGAHINITGTTIKATDYVHSEQPVATSSVTPVVTGSMISNGTITADKLATGATLKLTLSTSDIGEGSALAANTLYGVYQ